MARAKKRAQEGRWTLALVDESYFSPTPVVRKTWAPRGQRPNLIHKQGKWDKVSAISAVTSRRGLYFRLLQDDAFDKHDIAGFVQHLLCHIRGDLVVIWDNGPQHHAKVVTALPSQNDRLRIVFLPPYSPDMNPDEGVWDHTKVVELGNFCPKDTKELVSEARAALNRLRRRPAKIAEFWTQTILPLDGLESLLNIPEAG